MKIMVVGGGIFGTSIAITLSQNGYDVSLFESENDIVLKASKHNHNRLHYGFHYPRSISTGNQCQQGLEQFQNNFSDAIVKNFENYYLVHKLGKTSFENYISFCEELGLEFSQKFPKNIEISEENIIGSVLTTEPIFDHEIIQKILKEKLRLSKTKIFYNTKINKSSDLKDYDVIINTTYSNINHINEILRTPLLKLKFQDVIIPIFEMNHSKIGLTIMDGEFCSIMPKGLSENLYLLYHVKESVTKTHEGFYVPEEWSTTSEEIINQQVEKIYNKSSEMFPFLKKSKKVSFWREYRALPINNDDERLSSVQSVEINNKLVLTLISGKVSTCWSISENVLKILNEYIINR